MVQLPYFKKTIVVLRAVITKFHKSHPGTAQLEAAQDFCRISRGLEAIGKTRFGSIILAARSLERNIPALKHVVEVGIFDLDVSSML